MNGVIGNLGMRCLNRWIDSFDIGIRKNNDVTNRRNIVFRKSEKKVLVIANIYCSRGLWWPYSADSRDGGSTLYLHVILT